MSSTPRSEQEAIDNYHVYRNRYNDAANERNSCSVQEARCTEERNAAVGQLNSANTEKFNLEKRLEGIERIIQFIENGELPERIEKANKTIAEAGDNYKKSIRLTGGEKACDLEAVFHTKTVSEDSRIVAALGAYKTEKLRVIEQINTLKQTIASLSEQISSLNARINQCVDRQASLRHTMNECAYEMNYYSRFID